MDDTEFQAHKNHRMDQSAHFHREWKNGQMMCQGE